MLGRLGKLGPAWFGQRQAQAPMATAELLGSDQAAAQQRPQHPSSAIVMLGKRLSADTMLNCVGVIRTSERCRS